MTDYNKLNIEQHNAKPDDEGFIVINGLVEACAILHQQYKSPEEREEDRRQLFENHKKK